MKSCIFVFSDSNVVLSGYKKKFHLNFIALPNMLHDDDALQIAMEMQSLFMRAHLTPTRVRIIFSIHKRGFIRVAPGGWDSIHGDFTFQCSFPSATRGALEHAKLAVVVMNFPS